MRIRAIAACALLFSASTATARDYLTIDSQFTVCPWGDLKHCELLDAEKEKSLHLTESETRTLAQLKRFTEARSFSGQDAVDVLGKPSVGTNETGGVWFLPDGTSRQRSSFGMAFEKGKLVVVHYYVPGKLVMYWYRKIDSGRGKQ